MNGRKFTGKGDYSSNSIFLPAAGYYNNESVIVDGVSGTYWSCQRKNWDDAYCMCFDANNCNLGSEITDNCETGNSVRAVLDEAESPAPAAPVGGSTKGKATATIGGSDVDVNWVQLWKDGPKFAEYNVADKMSFTDAAKTGTDYVWGANWRTPSKDELDELAKANPSTGSEKVTCVYGQVGGVWGFTFTGKGEGYTGNSVFFPANGYEGYGVADYWSSTEDTEKGGAMRLCYDEGSYTSRWNENNKSSEYLVRAVLAE